MTDGELVPFPSNANQKCSTEKTSTSAEKPGASAQKPATSTKKPATIVKNVDENEVISDSVNEDFN